MARKNGEKERPSGLERANFSRALARAALMRKFGQREFNELPDHRHARAAALSMLAIGSFKTRWRDLLTVIA